MISSNSTTNRSRSGLGNRSRTRRVMPHTLSNHPRTKPVLVDSVNNSHWID